MAKKKQNQQKQPDPQAHTQPKMENNTQTPLPPPTEEDPSKEKLSSLKSLNSMLLKETVEKRQEISALLETKKSLESELTRSESEIEALKAELTQMKEGDVETDVKKEVVSVFMQSLKMEEREKLEKRLEEMEREKEEVEKERDEIEKAKFEADYEIGLMKKMEMELRNDIRKEKERFNGAIIEKNELNIILGVKIDEINRLKKKIDEYEMKEKDSNEKQIKLKVMYDVKMKDLEEKEKEVELIKNELNLLREESEELNKVVERLNGENEAILKENGGLCEERNELNERINGLVKEAEDLRCDVNQSRVKYDDLEEIYARKCDEFDGLKKEFDGLIDENKEKEKEIDGLIVEKSIVEKKLIVLEDELKREKQVYGEIMEEKVKLEQLKDRNENEIMELQKRLNEIQGNLSLLQESNIETLENYKKLALEVDDHKLELGKVSVERDEFKACLDEEKKNGVKLQGKVIEISKRMEETAKVMEDLRSTSDVIVEEKKEIEKKYKKMVLDKEGIEKECDVLKGKMGELERSLKAKSDVFELAMSMIRKTIDHLLMEEQGMKKNGEVGPMMVGLEEGMKKNGEVGPMMEEMRNVLKKREEKVGEMKEKMVGLEKGLMEAKKRKSFWTLVSSATTILAAVMCSFAYARVH
ncbi:unnamed protein product [Amaranthus hypochondriacus]